MSKSPNRRDSALEFIIFSPSNLAFVIHAFIYRNLRQRSPSILILVAFIFDH